jgi:hypothetical protein
MGICGVLPLLNAQKTIQTERISVPIAIDGVLDEPFWQTAEIAKDFTQIKPIAGKTASQPTEVRVVYDDESIYFGAVCYDTPESMSKILCQRDRFNANTDYFSVTLDTYNDQLNGFVFSVSTCGVQYDAKIYSNDYSSQLDMIWYSEVKHTDSSWVVEMKIPYSAIRFAKGDEQNWGINFARYISVNREESFWNEVKPDLDNIVTQAGKLKGIKNIEPPLRLFFLPYLSGYLQHYPVNVEGVSNLAYNINGGMDIKYGINEAFTLDMTLIPDFGQVVTDNVVLNLTPFEVRFDENRQFFSEGVELFEKAGLFYSRRVGVSPMGRADVYNQLNENEEVVDNPNSSRLYNATKLSGRTKSGLGIGVFNGISASQFASVTDTVTNTSRQIQTAPFTNYNVFVLDQNLKNNSSITFTNTNVWRDGHYYDANVTGLNSILNSKDNNYFLSLNSAVSQLYENKVDLGHNVSVGFGKQKGNFIYDLTYSEMSDSFDPNDLGFLYNNNQRVVNAFVGYNIYKPIGRFNRIWTDFTTTYIRMYNPNAYNETLFEGGIGATTKKFHSANLRFNAGTVTYDYFEPRTPGYFFISPNWYNVNGWISSNYQKRFALDLNLGASKVNNDDWRELFVSVSPRIRATDKIFLVYEWETEMKIKEQGFAIPFSGSSNIEDAIIFGKRDVITTINTLDLQYTLTNKMGITFRLRHYWSTVEYFNFYELQTDGHLSPSIETGLNPDNTSIYNTNYNAFSIDMVYRWVFAPASEFNIVWKNNIFTSDNFEQLTYYNNLRQTLATSQLNSLSFRVVYFIDYQSLKKLGRKK